MFSCMSPFCYCASEWSADVTADGWREACFLSPDQKRNITAFLFLGGLGGRQQNARSFTANDHVYSANDKNLCSSCNLMRKIDTSWADLPVLKLSLEHLSRPCADICIHTHTRIYTYKFIDECPSSGKQRVCVYISTWHPTTAYELLLPSIHPLKCSRMAEPRWTPTAE